MLETTERQRTDFTEGSVLGSILRMGLPSMIGFLSQHLYSVADMFWVSRLPEGENGVAAITFFTNLMWILFAFNSLIGPGSVAIISRRYGERDFDRTETAIKETLILKLFFGLLVNIVGLIFLPIMLRLLGAEGEAYAMGVTYGRIVIVGLPVFYAAYSIFTALRGVANPNLAMALMIGSNALNVILDPLLMFGWFGLPAYGIAGAAYATVASFAVCFVVGMLLFLSPYVNVQLHLRSRVPVSVASMWKMLWLGVPAWIGELSWSLSRLLITPIIATFGTGVVAAFGASMQVFGFGIALIVGIGLGLSSLIGHNLGALKYARAKTTADHAIWLGAGIMGTLGLLTFVFAETYMRIFFDNAETIRHGATLLRITAVGYPFFGAFIMLEQVHLGVGLNTPFMIVSIIHSWALQVLPAVIVTQVFGWPQTAVWWVLTISGMITTVAFYWYYQRGRWLTAKV